MTSGKIGLLLGATMMLAACANQSENRNAAKARDSLDDEQRQQQLQQAEQDRCGAGSTTSGTNRRVLNECDVDTLGRTVDGSLRPLGDLTAPLGSATQSLPRTGRLGL